MRNNKFTNKEEYLAYRSDWKVEYKALSQTIRERKWLHSRYSTIANKANVEVGMGYATINRYFNYIDVMSNEDVEYKEVRAKQDWRISKDRLSLTATIMLDELKSAKVEANRQYLKSKGVLEERTA